MTSATSSTLWATASKEWVIQPKPRPGRKPKKDVASIMNSDQAPDSKGRRVRNRAAQRAFRERKQSQLTELQARVQSYEQGEIERNVSLQNIAKLLKEENENLRRENLLLKAKVSTMELERVPPQENEKKRCRNDTQASPSSVSSMLPVTKKSKVTPKTPSRSVLHSSASCLSSPPSMESPPNSDVHSPSPLSLDLQSDPAQNSSFSNLLELSSDAKAATFNSGGVFPTFDCGFCNEDTPCVCRQIALQHSADRMGGKDLKVENYEPNHSIVPIQFEGNQTSILDSLPAYQPPIPLRRRTENSNLNTIFPVAPASQLPPASGPSCSGDPANCMACADDSFGRAFCAAIGESIATTAPCIDCPCSKDSTLNVDSSAPKFPADRCCGDPSKCGCHPPSVLPTSSIPISSLMQPDSETIPTNDAWRQLKSHPNVEFTDLSLLADVVARRSKCTGPLTTAPRTSGSIPTEWATEWADPSPNYNGVSRVAKSEREPVLRDPLPHYREREPELSRKPPSPPQLVPEEELMRCGRRWRVRKVHAHAVRDALSLLDAKFSQS